MFVKKLEISDLEIISRIHIDSFNGFFLSILGEQFLKEFYQCHIEDNQSIALAAIDEDIGIIGAVVGSLEPSGFYMRALKSKVFKFAVAALPSAIRNPFIIPRLMKAFLKPKEAKNHPGDCELMSICVSRKYFGVGVGSLLERSFCSEAKLRGAKIVVLSTDKNKNEQVNNFYTKNGYVLFDSFFSSKKREKNRYIKYL